MNVTLVDIATRTNLNKGTVSRILNGKAVTCTPETRQRVLDTAAEMGYQPNMLARALQTGRTNTIALWFLTHTHYSPYFGALQHYLQRIAKQHHYHMLTETAPLSLSQEPYDREAKPLSWPVDGVISSYMAQAAIQYLQSSIKKDCPMVCLQQYEPENMEVRPYTDFVLLDINAGARQAVEHLLNSGCSRIAFVGEPQIFDGDVRAQVYRELLRDAGKQIEHVVSSGGNRRSAFDGMKAYIERFGCPDGVFCPNDEFAIGCYLAMQKMGIRVPDDTLLVGFDGLENAELFPCPISSVLIPLEEMCTLAWDMLIQRINDPGRAMQQQLFTPRLEIRESSLR